MNQFKIFSCVKHYPLIIIVALYLFFAFFTFKDYGITFDENTEYTWGSELWEHYNRDTKFRNTIEPVFNGEEAHRRHTPVLSQYYRLYPAGLSALNFRNTYEFYHLLNFLFASTLIPISYIFLYEKYKNPYFASLGPLFIFLTPRFLGHIPANPKDMPFAVMYFLGILSIYYSQKISNDYLKILFMGIVFGLVQSLRIVGFSIYFVYLLWIIREYFIVGKHTSIKRFIQSNFFPFLFIGIVAGFVMIVTWPYIGINFFKNFQQIFIDSKNFEFWDKSFLYLGEYITIHNRPWHYLPVFIFVTTPVIVLVSFFAALTKIKRLLHNDAFFLLISALTINILLYLVFRPVIYNGLRHYLFLLPIISVIGSMGFIEIIKSKSKIATLLVVFAILNLSLILWDLKSLHPYEYIYFNELTGGTNGAFQKFELDYWGASYKEAAEFLNNNEEIPDSTLIYTCANTYAVEYYLKPELKVIHDFKIANYVICDQERSKENKISLDAVKTVERNGAILNLIYKTK